MFHPVELKTLYTHYIFCTMFILKIMNKQIIISTCAFSLGLNFALTFYHLLSSLFMNVSYAEAKTLDKSY